MIFVSNANKTEAERSEDSEKNVPEVYISFYLCQAYI